MATLAWLSSTLATPTYSSFPSTKLLFYSIYLLRIKSLEHIYLYDVDEEENKQARHDVENKYLLIREKTTDLLKS